MSAALIREARPEDAVALATLVDMAGEGLASYVWAGLAEPGQSPQEVGIARAKRDEGAFSWRNAQVAEVAGQAAGALIAYDVGDTSEPLEGVEPLFQPLVALENEVLGSRYINVLAVLPAFRRQGVASTLLRFAQGEAREDQDLSLVVSGTNIAARALYAAHGFAETARLPVVKGGWQTQAKDWILLVRPAALARQVKTG